MIANAYNWQDIRKYYSDTFILVPEVTQHVLHVTGVDTKYIYVQDINGEKGGIELTKEGYTIQDLLPRKQYFQLNDKSAGFIFRIPARMWRKGCCTENTKMCRVTGNGNLETIPISHSNLEEFYKVKHTFKTLDSFRGDTASLALSERVAVISDQTLVIDGYPVGQMSKNKKKVLVMKEFEKWIPKNGMWEIKGV